MTPPSLPGPVVRGAMAGLVLAVMAATSASAHPGVGIVMDRSGNVLYTDLAHVWRIAPDGTKSIAVRNVHTHELYLDPQGTLHGEHLWFANERWFHYTWQLTALGALTKSPQREGFRRDMSFVRDGAGRMFWYDAAPTPAIVRRTTDGRTTRLGERATFLDVRWMTAAPDGTVYFTDHDDLRALNADGAVVTLATGLRDRADHWVGGVWLDAQGRVYVAVWGGRAVKRFDPASGRVDVVARSPAPWGPSGGLVAPNGDLWLLETAEDNTVRVRRISSDGRERIH